MRFTIRDVLWLTAVVAILFGWGIDHRNMIQQQRVTEDLLIHKAVGAELAAEAAKEEAASLRSQLDKAAASDF